MAGWQPVEVSEHLAAINSQRRVLVTLRLERRAKDVTPDLHTYLHQHYGTDQEAVE